MEIAGIIISIIALILSAYTYFKHDYKIKQQEKLLNDYQIAKIETEKVESLKAIIEANTFEIKNGKNVIKVYNKGKCEARNVNVTIPENEGYEVLINPCPINIKPQNGIEILLLLFMNYPDKIKIEFEWSDDFKENNKESQDVQLI